MKNAEKWVCYSLANWKYHFFLFSQCIKCITIHAMMGVKLQYLSIFWAKILGLHVFKRFVSWLILKKIIGLPLSKMADCWRIWRKTIGLPLSEMADFWLILKKIIGLPLSEMTDFLLNSNKNHRVTSIQNSWFLANFAEKS